MNAARAPMRVLHFSDPHLESGLEGVSPGAFVNKRALGFANLLVRRRRHFGAALNKLEALARLADQLGVQFTLCTGDYTALGTRAELEASRRLLEPLLARELGYATVPGNHDLYVDDAPGAFEGIFADGLRSDRDDCRWDRGEPYLRLVGDRLAIVGLASARPNPLHSSSGAVPERHLEVLRRLVSDPALAPRFLLVAVHYAPRLWDGRPDTALHGLDNHAALLDAVAGLRFGALVFGHVHHGYSVRIPGVAAPLVGAGSATYEGRATSVLWELDRDRVVARRLRFENGEYRADPRPELELSRPT